MVEISAPLIQRVVRRLAYRPKTLAQALSEPRLRFVEGTAIDPVESPAIDPALLRRLCDSYLAAKDHQQILTSPYAPAVEWKRILDSEWRRPREMIERGDLDSISAFLANFFRNEGLTGFWGSDRMFERFAREPWSRRIIRAGSMDRQIATWREYFPDTPLGELAATPVGNPWGYRVGGHIVYEPACEYHLQAAQFAKLLDDVSSPVVLEIGGGFGGLAWHLVKRMPRVKYIGVDLPENALLQAYYLASAYPKLKLLTWSPGMASVDAAVMAAHDVIILPNFAMPAIADSSVDLVVNVRSLSEMPTDTIAEYLCQIDRIGRHFFFHENIYKERLDGLYGIPSVRFPPMDNFVELFTVESRWPKYNRQSSYPCRENLLIQRSSR